MQQQLVVQHLVTVIYFTAHVNVGTTIDTGTTKVITTIDTGATKGH